MADLEAYGAPPEVVEQCRQQAAVEDFDVLAENRDTLAVFLRLSTQWTIVNGCVFGLNYQSVEFLFRVFDVKDPAETLDDLQAMEGAALAIFSERKAAE